VALQSVLEVVRCEPRRCGTPGNTPTPVRPGSRGRKTDEKSPPRPRPDWCWRVSLGPAEGCRTHEQWVAEYESGNYLRIAEAEPVLPPPMPPAPVPVPGPPPMPPAGFIFGDPPPPPPARTAVPAAACTAAMTALTARMEALEARAAASTAACEARVTRLEARLAGAAVDFRAAKDTAAVLEARMEALERKLEQGERCNAVVEYRTTYTEEDWAAWHASHP
jgi:hypothetical protein